MIPAIKWLNFCENKIFTINSETFTLYNVQEVNKYDQELLINLINSCSISVPTVKQEQDTVRSFALDHSQNNYLALGFTSGRITVFTADNIAAKFIRGEEIREIQKSISYLEWNFTDSNRLCAAYERSRGPDHTVVVYDLNRTSLKSARELAVSVFETNFAERIYGISWFKEDPNLLLISGSRGIRIADIREHGNFQSTLSTPNPLMGVCSEPTHGFIFSCYSRSNILVYDRRFLTYSPLYEIEASPSNKIINKLSWHPRRSFHMSAITKDSGNFYNFSIAKNAFRPHYQKSELPINHLQAESHRKNSEYSYGTHIYSVPGISKLCSFDWHPIMCDRVAVLPANAGNRLMVSNQAKDLVVINIKENVSCDITCNSELAITNENVLNIDPHSLIQIDKIRIIKERVANGYGYGNTSLPILSLIENSKKAIEQDPYVNDDLRFCWRWLWSVYHAPETVELQKTFGTTFYGIKHILKGTKSNSTIKHDEITYRNRIFVNERRLKVVRLCNWPNYNDRDDCKMKFDELASGTDVRGIARAAALALFSVQGTLSREYLIRLNDFVHSQEFLDSGQCSKLISSYQRMIDIVLSVIHKYDGVRVPDYENICGEISSDAYLLAIVKFLARRDKIYNRIYNEIFESDIEFEDKLAFAALHMDDDLLSVALNKLTKEMLVARPLSTLFIIGLEDQLETHQTIHRYLDISEDIQTASILFIIGNCFQKFTDLQDLNLIGANALEISEFILQSGNCILRRSFQCVRDYIELLNRCQLWLQKSFLCILLRPSIQPNDIDLRSQLKNIQAVIACNYCGQPIYPSVAEKIENIRTPKVLPSYPRRGGMNIRTRTISCICRKVLPRCIICRKHLGSQMEVADTEIADGVNLNPGFIDNWFVWCSNCNHGGHLAHIRDWFYDYSVCASSGCDCFCLQIDRHLNEELRQPRR